MRSRTPHPAPLPPPPAGRMHDAAVHAAPPGRSPATLATNCQTWKKRDMRSEECRATLAHAVSLPPALGTLCRRPVTVGLHPAEIGAGLSVRRLDTGQEWAIGLDTLVAATNCTAVGDDSGSVAFLEHLLAALWAGGLSDVLITTDGPEIPLYDGSAQALWAAVQEGGRIASAEPWEPLTVTAPPVGLI